MKPDVSRQVWAMIQLQRFTGMRSGEVVIMRASDIEMDRETWIYRPSNHKTEHHGRQREVALGPQAQAVLREFVTADIDAYLFSPRDATTERYANASVHRRPNQQNLRKTSRRIGDAYSVDSYRRAISRACKSAGIPHWHPHQLRHNFATYVRKEHGIEAARVVLGHASAAVTEIYAELDHKKAMEIMARVG